MFSVFNFVNLPLVYFLVLNLFSYPVCRTVFSHLSLIMSVTKVTLIS